MYNSETEKAPAISTYRIVSGESRGDSAHRFEPGKLSDDAARILRSLLGVHHFDLTTRLPQPGGKRWRFEPVRMLKFLRGGVNCWKASPLSPFYRRLVERAHGSAPLVLFDLFFLHEPVPLSRIGAAIGPHDLRTLEEATVLCVSKGEVTALARCYPLRGMYFLFDTTREHDDFIYFGRDSQLMVDITAEYCDSRHFYRSLDLCTGSGVQGLSVSPRSEAVLCSDINPRAVATVEANIRLNGLKNVRAVRSDLLSDIDGRFDCITANTPYVPLPSGGKLPIRGGDTGVEFTMRLLEELPARMTEQGIAIVYTSDPIVGGKRLLMDHVGKRFGNLPLRIVHIPLFRNNYPFSQPLQQHYDRLGLRGYDDCVLIIGRARRYQALRRQWDWKYYQYTRFDAWLDWLRRGRGR